MPKPITAIGFLGTQLDDGRGQGRWQKWRPTVALAQRPDQPLARLELLVTDARYTPLAQQVAADVAQVSPGAVVNTVKLPITDPWDFAEVYGALYDWLRGYDFAPDTQDYWAHITTGTHVAQICLFLLTEARYLPGVLAQTAPPRPQRTGDPGSLTLIDLDIARYDPIAQRFAAEHADAQRFLKRGIATRNPAFNALIEEIERVAVRSRAPLLLTGPTGAGKSFLARQMYELKRARHQTEGPFVEVNCATLRGDSAHSTLFGHKKGAFTGAAADRAGLLKAADGGVLFLDEIGELGADEQAMLLKAIEEKRFYPLGSDKEVASDFQLIVGTNRDLRDDVAAGRFREDLFARINLWSYTLPGLAQRPEDIEPNLDYLLALAARDVGQQVRFAPEARKAYLRFATSAEASWTGNFRDLSASVTRMATLASGGRIELAIAEAEVQRLRWLWARSDTVKVRADAARTTTRVDATLGEVQSAALDPFDQVQLEFVLEVCASSRSLSDAGRRLFSASRAARAQRGTAINDADRLRKYLARFGLNWPAVST
jgi:transcriptional regulatory protein RtcR